MCVCEWRRYCLGGACISLRIMRMFKQKSKMIGLRLWRRRILWKHGEQTASGGDVDDGMQRIIIIFIVIVSVLFLDKLIGGGRTMVDGWHSTTNTAASGSDNAVGNYRTAGITKSSVATIKTGRTSDHHARWGGTHNCLWWQRGVHLIATLAS